MLPPLQIGGNQSPIRRRERLHSPSPQASRAGTWPFRCVCWGTPRVAGTAVLQSAIAVPRNRHCDSRVTETQAGCCESAGTQATGRGRHKKDRIQPWREVLGRVGVDDRCGINSALPRISKPVSSLSLRSRMSGVLPTAPVNPSLIDTTTPMHCSHNGENGGVLGEAKYPPNPRARVAVRAFAQPGVRRDPARHQFVVTRGVGVFCCLRHGLFTFVQCSAMRQWDCERAFRLILLKG